LVEERSLKFSIKVVNKTEASVTQFAKCILLHTYNNCSSQLREHKQKLYIAYLTNLHNCIFGYILRTD